MYNVLTDAQTDEQRMDSIRKSFSNLPQVVSFEEFEKSHIQNEDIEVYTDESMGAFFKAVQDQAEAAEGDTEQIYMEAEEMVKSLSHQIVSVGGKKCNFYFKPVTVDQASDSE